MKFANSLRLRLAMRIASVAPDKACAEIQKIKENDYGFFEAETGGAIVSTKSGYTNPLGELNRVWNETYMSANMESILVGYNDPRLGIYFELCTDETLKGQFVKGHVLLIVIIPDCRSCLSCKAPMRL